MGTSHSPPWFKHLSYWIWCFGLLCVCAHIASGSRVVVVVAKGNEMCWTWPNCIDHMTHAKISSQRKKRSHSPLTNPHHRGGERAACFAAPSKKEKEGHNEDLCCWRRLWHWSLCDDVMAFVLQCCCTDACPVSFPLLTTTEEYRGRTLCDPRCQMVLTAPGPLQSAGMYVYISICVRMCMPSLPSFFCAFSLLWSFAAFYDSEWCGCLAYGEKLQWFILRLLLLGGFVVCSSHTPFHLQLMLVCYHYHNKEESSQRIGWWWLLAGVIRTRVEKSWKSVKRFWC